MTDLRFTSRFAALLLAGGVVAGCSSPSPTKIDYKSDSKAKEVSLAIPPNLIDETSDQRSLPPQGGEASLSSLEKVQKDAPAENTNDVMPPAAGMHIQRVGTESWLVVDGKSPDDVWPLVRRFWLEQGFLLVVDQRDTHVMETDWNETRPQVNQGLIRNTLSKAMGNSYVAAERNKYRVRLEASPDGGTYVFVSEKGLGQTFTGPNNETSKWEAKPNDPALETEYLKRMMAALAVDEARAGTGGGDKLAANAPTTGGAAAATATTAATATATAPVSAMPVKANAAEASVAARNVAAVGDASAAKTAPAKVEATATSTELTLAEPYDRAWLRVGIALDRANFTVDDRDRTRGIYFIRYVDPTDLSSDEQGFWNQIFHGKKEKVAKQYRINVRAVTETETRVAVIDAKGDVDSSKPAKQIMSLVVDQLQ